VTRHPFRTGQVWSVNLNSSFVVAIVAVIVGIFAAYLIQNSCGVAVSFADYSGCTDCNVPRAALAPGKNRRGIPSLQAHHRVVINPFYHRVFPPFSRLAVTAVMASSLMCARLAIGQAGPQPPAAAAPIISLPAAAPAQQIEAYSLNADSREVLAAWQKYAIGRTDMRVAIDERTSQVLVWAPAAMHGQIRQQLAAKGATAPTAQLAPPPAAPAGPVVLQLKNMQVNELRPRLERLLSRQLPITSDAASEWQSFSVGASPGVGVTMNVNTRSGHVRIEGPPLQAAAWRSVLEALDSPPTAEGNVTHVVATRPANHDRVRMTLQTLQTSSHQSAEQNASLVAMQQPAEQDASAAAGQPAPAQPPAPGQPATQIAPGSAQTAIDAARIAEAAGGLLGPVQVEFVEGLDVIVLRGSERDVQRVLEIINQIEQLSAVTVPSVVVHELKNVDSVQLGTLLQRLYTSVLESRIGQVSITPLGKPNALLLIGRDENVKMAVELINQLDKPVVPTARFEVFPLRHAAAAEVKTLIDNFLGQPTGQPTPPPAGEVPTLAPRALVVADARTNSLVVSAGPRDMAEISALVQRIDQPGATAELKVFTVINGDATTLVETLRALFGTPEQADAAGGGGLGAGGQVRIQFSVDPRTNSIIAAGSREDLAVVEAILLRLDQGDLRERKTSVYRLNNAFAANLADALNYWLQTERQVEATAELAVSPFEQIEREVIIVPEIATNSLIVSATPRFYEEILRIIRELDERPPMVLVQVLIAEVRLNDADQFGVELGLQDSVLFDRSLLSDVQQLTTTVNQQVSGTAVSTTQQTVINAEGRPGFNFNNPNLPLGNNLSSTALATASQVGAQGLSSFALNRFDQSLGFSGFVFSASSDAVSVLLRALQERRRLEVLSRPQLMALDGQQGQVLVGQDVPTIQQTNFDQFGGTINTIQYRSVGLIMQLIPRISPDGLVVMQISAEKSEVGPELEGIPISISTNGQILRAPRIERTNAITTVSALSGQTVILSGLLQTRKSDIHRRVPIIADIPLIGNLFRFDSVIDERRELLIILTPQIIYNKIDSDLVKQIESSRMSWILSDVVNLHGEAGLRSRCDEWFEGECDSIYPNMMPEEGVLPLSREQTTSAIEGECVTPQYEPQESYELMPQIVPPANGELLPEPAPSPPPDDLSRQQGVKPTAVNPAVYSTALPSTKPGEIR
jgi:type II secretion system protein D